MQWMRLMICCGIAVNRMGVLVVRECEEDEDTDCEVADSDTDW